jgi:hypothetical protein
MADKKPRRESGMMNTIPPNPEACKTCLFRPSEYNGLKVDRADTCRIFEYSESKPHDVLWDGAKCEHCEKAV